MSNPSKKPMTREDVRRMQSAIARKNGAKVPKGSYVAKIMSYMDKNEKP